MRRGAYHESHVSVIHSCSTMKEVGARVTEAAEPEKSILMNDNKTQWSLIGIGLTLFFIQNTFFDVLRWEEYFLIFAIFSGFLIFFNNQG